MYACVTINIMQPKRKYPVAVQIRQNLDDLMNAMNGDLVIDIGWGLSSVQAPLSEMKAIAEVIAE